jgi:hypothetical protein
MTQKKHDEPDFEIPFTSYTHILHSAGDFTDPAVVYHDLIRAGDTEPAKRADLTPAPNTTKEK